MTSPLSPSSRHITLFTKAELQKGIEFKIDTMFHPSTSQRIWECDGYRYILEYNAGTTLQDLIWAKPIRCSCEKI